MLTAYEPQHLEHWRVDGPTGFDSAANYSGPHFSMYFQAPVAITRDADTLATSNWHVVTESILKVAQHDATEIHRMGHWGCGWYEILLIHPDDGAALEAADNWAAVLSEYPVADDEHYSQLQWDTACDNWDGMTLRSRIEACESCGISIMAARRDEIPEDPQGSMLHYLTDAC